MSPLIQQVTAAFVRGFAAMFYWPSRAIYTGTGICVFCQRERPLNELTPLDGGVSGDYSCGCYWGDRQ